MILMDAITRNYLRTILYRKLSDIVTKSYLKSRIEMALDDLEREGTFDHIILPKDNLTIKINIHVSLQELAEYVRDKKEWSKW